MNVRKPIDYTAMFAALDETMVASLPQMKQYFEIGRLISGRPEEGAAVAAAEYLCATYPDTPGFSPRNLRRMREFYRAYESVPEVLSKANGLGWTRNVVILEAELTLHIFRQYDSLDGRSWSCSGKSVFKHIRKSPSTLWTRYAILGKTALQRRLPAMPQPRIHNTMELAALVQQMGFLPFFVCSILKFSVEEFTPSRCWFSDGVDGP